MLARKSLVVLLILLYSFFTSNFAFCEQMEDSVSITKNKLSISEFVEYYQAEYGDFTLVCNVEALVNLDRLLPAHYVEIKKIIIRGTCEKFPLLPSQMQFDELQCSGCGLADVSGLQMLKVRRLILELNPLTDFGAISQNKYVEYLSLKGTLIKKIPDHVSMDNLKIINLSNTPLKDIEYLAGLKRLETVYILGCLSLESIDELLVCKNLDVYIDKTGVSVNGGTDKHIGAFDRFASWYVAHGDILRNSNIVFHYSF